MPLSNACRKISRCRSNGRLSPKLYQRPSEIAGSSSPEEPTRRYGMASYRCCEATNGSWVKGTSGITKSSVTTFTLDNPQIRPAALHDRHLEDRRRRLQNRGGHRLGPQMLESLVVGIVDHVDEVPPTGIPEQPHQVPIA